MARSIQGLLDQILSAVYGEEVRGAIHDSIEQCYDDVASASTIAEASASRASDAAQDAENAAALITDANTGAIVRAESAILSANTAVEDANAVITAANNAVTQTQSATTAANSAATAANNAANNITNPTNGVLVRANAAITTIENQSNSMQTMLNTTIPNAVASANTARDNANNAAAEATNAAASATNAASSASNSATTANNAAALITNANTGALARADSAINEINSLINNTINPKISDMDTATTNATEAASMITRGYYGGDYSADGLLVQAEHILQRAENASENAEYATTAANSATLDANMAAVNANSGAQRCETAVYDVNIVSGLASDATNRANLAASAIELMTVTSEEITEGTSSATINTTVNPYNVHFRIRKGDRGEAFVIKGEAYANLDALSAAIPYATRVVGDMYNVGTEAPYNVYRWNGSYWEDQGTIGINFSKITSGDIDTLWSGTTISGEDRFLDDDALSYLINSKIKSALNGKVDTVSGKGLSTNDFTTAYIDLINGHTSSISTLQSTKVTAVDGKGLSTNDYTTAERTKLNGIAEGATRVLLDSSLQASSSNGVKNSVVANAVDNLSLRSDSIRNDIAAEFNQSSTYAVGDFCTYNDVLYRCTNAIVYTGNSWNSNFWTPVKIGNIIQSLQNVVSNISFSYVTSI